jgi:serine/threonine protein kinase
VPVFLRHPSISTHQAPRQHINLPTKLHHHPLDYPLIILTCPLSDHRYYPQDGVNFSVLREIKVLMELKHTNIVELLDVRVTEDGLELVLDYCEMDLKRVRVCGLLLLCPSVLLPVSLDLALS